jgi:hypothetical protein
MLDFGIVRHMPNNRRLAMFIVLLASTLSFAGHAQEQPSAEPAQPAATGTEPRGTEDAAPFFKISPQDRKYDYSVAVLKEELGQTQPGNVVQTYDINIFNGDLKGRMVILRNSQAAQSCRSVSNPQTDYNPLGLVLNVNDSIYFAPVHLLRLTKNPRFYPVREPEEDAGIYLTLVGKRCNPFSGREEDFSTRLKVTSLDGQTLPELVLQELDPLAPATAVSGAAPDDGAVKDPSKDPSKDSIKDGGDN